MKLTETPFNNFNGIGSAGCMNNPMYRHIAVDGTYEPQTGRCKRRTFARRKGKCLSKHKKLELA